MLTFWERYSYVDLKQRLKENCLFHLFEAILCVAQAFTFFALNAFSQGDIS